MGSPQNPHPCRAQKRAKSHRENVTFTTRPNRSRGLANGDPQNPHPYRGQKRAKSHRENVTFTTWPKRQPKSEHPSAERENGFATLAEAEEPQTKMSLSQRGPSRPVTLSKCTLPLDSGCEVQQMTTTTTAHEPACATQYGRRGTRTNERTRTRTRATTPKKAQTAQTTYH